MKGFDLVIIPDNDESGRRCAAKVARDCYGKTARVRVLELPGLEKGGDLSDWIKVGGTGEKLLELLSTAGEFDPETGFTIGGQPLLPIVNLEIDLSGLPETEDDDPPVSGDPRREIYLRQLARNAAKVLEACAILLRLLGFEKDHTRLLAALISIGRDRLNYFKAYHAAIREQYAATGEASSIETVRRDLKRLRQEQATLGVTLVGYRPGSRDFATGKSYPCRFQNLLLRYALQAINISIDTRDDFKTARRALEAACRQVMDNIPRNEPMKKTEQPKKELTVEDLEARLLALQEQLVAVMLADGWTPEEMEEEIELQHRRFYDRLKQASNRRQGEPAAEEYAEEVIQIL